MNSYVQNTHQLIFTPKHRQPVLEANNRKRLFAYARGFFKNKDCPSFAIDGVEDHLHFVYFQHPSIALADLVRDLKRALHTFIDDNHLFPMFTKWQLKYSDFSYSYRDRDNVIAYVNNQVNHHAHQHESYIDELRRLYEEHGLKFHEKFLK